MEEKKDKKEEFGLRDVFKTFAGIGQIGLTIAASTFVGIMIGYYLDKWTFGGKIFTVIFFILGLASGIWNAYKMFSKMIKEQLKDEDKRTKR